MKDLEDAAIEYENKELHIEDGQYTSTAIIEAFKAGVEFAQQWISCEDELPPCSDEDILIKGIDSDGRENMPDIGYMHSSNDNKPSKENFISLSGEITEITHWRPINIK